MSIKEIEITSNSNPDSIRNDFSSQQSILKLQISLEIEINQEDIILCTLAEQLQSFILLEELSIIISKQCILEQFHILTEGLTQLIHLKTFSITFQSYCSAGEIHFGNLLSAFKRMTQLTDLIVRVESNNFLNQKAIQLLNESLTYLSCLLKLKIQISEGNQFDDQTAEELSQGFKNTALLEELELQLDCTYMTEKGMLSLNNLLQSVNKTLMKLKIIIEGRCKFLGLSQIFKALPSLCKLRELTVESMLQQNIEEQEVKSIVESLSKLTFLEAFTLQKILSQQYANNNILMIKQLQYFNNLQKLDLEILNFNEITLDSSMILQDALSGLKNLECLKLIIKDSTSFENQSIKFLANTFEKLKKLTSLELSFQCIVNYLDNMHLMESLKHLICISSLTLHFGSQFFLDEELLDSLGESLRHLTHLRQLYLIILNVDLKPIEYFTDNLNEKSHFQDLPQNLKHRKKLNFHRVNFDKLNNLEELIVRNSEETDIQVQDMVIELKNLEKLRILEMSCQIDRSEIAQSFSQVFFNLKQLTHLSLSLRINKNLLQTEQFIIFLSFSLLISLTNLNLSFDDIVSQQQSEWLGLSLLFLTNVTTFQLELKSNIQSLECLQNILFGFSNCKLKTFNLKTGNSISFKTNKQDFKIFSALQYLENISLDRLSLEISFDISNKDILIDSLKELYSLKQIKIVVDYETNLYKEQNYLLQLLQSFPNLVDIQIRDKIGRSESSSKGFDQLKVFNSKLKIRDIQFKYWRDQTNNLKICSFMEQLQNLRSLYLHSNLFDSVEYYQNPPKPLLNGSSRLLAKLEFVISKHYFHYFCSYYPSYNCPCFHELANELKQIKQFKYLTDLSIDFREYNSVQATDLITFGQSLQQIDQIKHLDLKLALTDQCTSEALEQLSKGISQQKHLKALSIQIKDLSRNFNQSLSLTSIVDSLKKLFYLTNLKIIFVDDIRSFKQENSQKNYFPLGLGKNLSFISHLRELNIMLRNNDQFKMNHELSQLANAFKQNLSLVSLRINVLGLKVNDKSAQVFGEGLSYLKQLEACEILFKNSEINNCSSFISVINSLENIRYFIFTSGVKKFSFVPLDLILKQKEGQYTPALKYQEFNIKFISSQMQIIINQSNKYQFQMNQMKEYMKLMTFMTTLPTGIQIDLGLQSCYLNQQFDFQLAFQQLASLQTLKLQLMIGESNINLFSEENYSLKQVKELDIIFKGQNINLDQLFKALNNLTKQIGNITKLNLNIQKQFRLNRLITKQFISSIIKFSSLKILIVEIYNQQQADSFRKTILRKLFSITILNIIVNREFLMQHPQNLFDDSDDDDEEEEDDDEDYDEEDDDNYNNFQQQQQQYY